MRSKKFSQEWHDTNDPRSREVVIKYMKALGFNFHGNKVKWGVDLVSDFSHPMVALELEHRSIWDRDQYPYDIIHIPYRKLRYLGSNNVHYVVVNKEFNMIGICLGKNLKEYLGVVTEVRNKAVSSGEYFINVPRAEFRWLKI